MTETAGSDPNVRERLVAAAIELFNERGYEATSVNDLVKRAGATKGSFYHYYTAKSDCLRELRKSFIEGELVRLEEGVEASAGPAEAIHAVFRAFLFGVQQNRSLNRIFDQEWRHVEGVGFEDIRRQRDRIAEIVTEQLQLGMSQGLFVRSATPNVLALAIIGMCGWAHRWFQPEGALSYEQLADSWADTFLQGITVSH